MWSKGGGGGGGGCGGGGGGGGGGGWQTQEPEAQGLPAEEEVEEKTCRLCWGDEDDGPLVQPCACRGTAKFIHSHCLEEWRRTSPKEDAAYRCCQCMKGYRDALSLELICAHGSRPSARMARAHSSPGMRSPRS